MSTATLISVEEYLRTSYEHDCEYVRGEVVERGMPTTSHSRAQTRLLVLFDRLSATHNLEALAELRNRLAPDLYRIPDVAVYRPRPTEEVPSTPPLIAIEIVSPDERLRNLFAKCEEYAQWGVAHVWVIDPARRSLQYFDGVDLRTVAALSVPELDIALGPAEVFG